MKLRKVIWESCETHCETGYFMLTSHSTKQSIDDLKMFRSLHISNKSMSKLYNVYIYITFPNSSRWLQSSIGQIENLFAVNQPHQVPNIDWTTSGACQPTTEKKHRIEGHDHLCL